VGLLVPLHPVGRDGAAYPASQRLAWCLLGRRKTAHAWKTGSCPVNYMRVSGWRAGKVYERSFLFTKREPRRPNSEGILWFREKLSGVRICGWTAVDGSDLAPYPRRGRQSPLRGG
jgi:hypothetical protein